MPTKIQWATETWNPVTGCSKVSPGCDNCYAEAMAKRFHREFNTVTIHPGRPMGNPFRWRKPRKIFVCSVSDLFHPRVPFERIQQVFCVMGACPQHTYQILTKRPGRLAYFANHYHPPLWDDRGTTWGAEWPPNVWAGTSVETQKYAPRIDVLARVPAKVRFVSVEPMLGIVELNGLHPHDWLQCHICHGHGEVDGDMAPGGSLTFHGHTQVRCPACGGRGRAVDWVIIGGESGPKARPLQLDWIRDLLGQCWNAGVPVFVKQLGTVWAKQNGARDYKGGAMEEWPEEFRIREWPK